MSLIRISTAGLLALLLTSASAENEEWSQFRGPRGGGVAPDTASLPVELDAAHNLRWSCDVPPGHSSPCLFGDRIFVTGASDRDVETVCVDRESGRVLWERRALTDTFESRHRINSPATPTATADGERVYVYFGSCGITSYDFDGNEQWLRRYRIPENRYGTAASLIVAQDVLVFLSDNATGSFLQAMELETGETRWRKERPNLGAGWSTPMHWNNAGVDEVVTYGTGWITAYDLFDGTERWSMPGLTSEPCITPVVSDGVIYLTSYNMRFNSEVEGLPEFDELLAQYDTDEDGMLAYPEIRANRSILSRNDADGEGDHPLPGFFRYLDEDRDGKITSNEWGKMIAFLDNFEFANALMAIQPPSSPGGSIEAERETRIVWQHPRGVPECSSPLVYGGRVYMVKNGGLVSCLDAKTGELHYEGRLGAGGPYYASPVAGDGKIYAASARGVVTVIRAADTLEVLANNDLGERIMATPALVDGTVYVRTESRLYAFAEED